MTLTHDLRRELERSDIDYGLIKHRHTERATDEARALGVSPEHVAKTVVLTTDDGYIRAVIAACDHLDLHKVRGLLGSNQHVRLATEAELVVAYPMYELGAVPPFGGPAGDRVLFDDRLAKSDSVIIEAGTHEESLRMKSADLVKLAGAEVADISASGFAD